MSIYKRILFLTCGFGILLGCEKSNDQLFNKLDKDKTNISFINEITETKKLNVMQYEYIYNGGGVGIGDFNGDTLPDIYFTGNMVPNKLYLNQGDFKFNDVTSEAGVAGKDAWASGVSIADVNGDGLLDIYVCYSGLGDKEMRSNQLFINQGNNDQNIPTFIDKAKDYGVDAPGTFTTQATFFDYDLDGDLDLFLLNHASKFYSPFFNSEKLRNTRHPYFGNRLYKNENNFFIDISEEAGVHGSGLNFGLGVAISDFNLDGYPDIYVSNDYEEQDFLYINLKNGKFKDSSHQSMGHLSKSSMGNDAADLNNDGLVDLMTLDMIPEDNYRKKILKGPNIDYDRYQLALDSGFHYQQMRNMLHYNRGINEDSIPVFSEIGQYAGVYGTDWSWSVLLADYDNDSRKDLFITNGYLRDFTNMDFVKFHLVEAIKKERFMGRELFDEKGKRENEDLIFELLKKIPITKISNYAFRNEGDFHFENMTVTWGLDDLNISTGSAYADLDLDGDLDLVVTLTNEPPAIYRNETDNKTNNNYVSIRLHGNNQNTFAIGARVWLYTDSSSQLVENFPVRGYQSSVDPVLHFGLGQESVKSIKIIWPNGLVTVDDNPASGALNHYFQKDAARPADLENKPPMTIEPLLKDITTISSIQYAHVENEFVDFKVDPLILKQYSKSGPKMSVGDVNADGLDDLYIGGASGQTDVLFLSQADGSFRKSDQPAFEMNRSCETTGSVFFDADKDGDLDLYAVSGGTDFRMGSKELRDVLYLNNGKGLFTKAMEGIVPVEYSNGSCVTAGDFDNDGDKDLFIGGGPVLGNYPSGSPGGLLINNVANGEFRFTIGTDQINTELREPGILNDARWIDINKDSFLDLIIVGEWIPIRVFMNENGKRLVEKTEQMNLGKTFGLWQCVKEADIDGDGDTDFIVGNMGKNLPFVTSSDQPLKVYAIDYYNNGNITPVICSYIQGKCYPVTSLDEIRNAIPDLSKKFSKYEDYAKATIEDIFPPEILARSKVYQVNTLESVLLINDGSDSFKIEALPQEVQYSAVEGIIFTDVTGDETDDILLTGNFYPLRVEYGPIDASIGTLLIGMSKGQYRAASQKELGVWIRGDVRDAKLLRTKNSPQIVISKNNDKIQVLELSEKLLPGKF